MRRAIHWFVLLALLVVVHPTLADTRFVAGFQPGTVRNNFSGDVGMKVTVAGDPILVTHLGRMCVNGNTGEHRVRIVESITGEDVPGASVWLELSEGRAGEFHYGALASPVVLEEGRTYFFVSTEVAGGDAWHDVDTTVVTASVGTVNSGIFKGSGYRWSAAEKPGHTYGPVDFKWTAVSAAGTSLPEVRLTSPLPGAVMEAPAAFSFKVDLGGDVTEVEYYLNGSRVGTVWESPFEFESPRLGSGTFRLEAVARGSAGLVSTSAPVNIMVVSNTAGNVEAFVTDVELKTPRNNFNGWVGMKISVGEEPLTVVSLGRYVFPGSAGRHGLKIVRARDQADVAGGSVSVSLAGVEPGRFEFGLLENPVRLDADTDYYVVSEEFVGGDLWGDLDTRVETTEVAVIEASVYFGSGLPWTSAVGLGDSYVPVSFEYRSGVGGVDGGEEPAGGVEGAEPSVAIVDPPETLPEEGEQAYVTFLQFSRTYRNDFTGFVGMKIMTGASPVRVTRLGRMYMEGNEEVHTVKIVDGVTEQDVGGASVEVSMVGGAPRQFVYGMLSSPVRLEANHPYFVVTSERAGGDQWYDLDTWANATPAATLVAPVYGSSGFPWTLALRPVTDVAHRRTFGPVDFMYVGSVAGMPIGATSAEEVRFAWQDQLKPELQVTTEGGRVVLILRGQAGNHVIEHSEDLQRWDILAIQSLEGESLRVETEWEATDRRRFYRARLQIP